VISELVPIAKGITLMNINLRRPWHGITALYKVPKRRKANTKALLGL